MDITTIIGLVLGVGLITGAIMMKTSILTFVDPASIAIVIGGSAAAVLVAFPLQQLLKVFGVAKKVIFTTPVNPVGHVKALVHLAEVARRDGILSLESQLNDGDHDEFMVRGLRMAIDGQDRSIIESAMESELAALIDRHTAGKAIFDNIGKYAPAFGMIGTLMGLIIMLGNMDDPSSIGAGMAVALITTLYGAIFSNLFCLPFAEKLGFINKHELLAMEISVRGIMGIQSGDNPRVIEQKLNTYLPPKLRAAAEESA